MTEFFDWSFVATLSGAAAMVTLITQVVKKYVSCDPKWVSLAISALIVFGTQLLYTQDFTIQGYIASVFNTILCAGTSIGVFETAKSVNK